MSVDRMPDVGGWFRTALRNPQPSRQAWGPAAGEFGKTSTLAEQRAALEQLAGSRVLVLTGAGVSTGSGLPDYRGQDAAPRSPMTYQEFAGSAASRNRFWTRSAVGWRRFAAAAPNRCHHAIAALADQLDITGVVTQNVDGLHQSAGSSNVIELHGSLSRVRCLGCEETRSQADFQQELVEANPQLTALIASTQDAELRPDGDSEISEIAQLQVPPCSRCGGIMKPDVVFFGETIPKATSQQAQELLQQSQCVLVLGTTLSVMSALRLVRQATKAAKPVVLLNDGATRADELPLIRLSGRIETVLDGWLRELEPQRVPEFGI